MYVDVIIKKLTKRYPYASVNIINNTIQYNKTKT